MKVEEVEHDAVREVAKASVIDNKSLARVDHLQSEYMRLKKAAKVAYLDVVQVLFVHSLELGNAGGDAR